MGKGIQIRRAVIAAVAIAASAAAVAEELTVPSRARLPSEVKGDLFAGPKPVVRAPKKPAPVVVEPKPSAPPFPYKYAGWVNDGSGAVQVFLQKGNQLIPIKRGAMLDDGWRVDALTEDRIEVSFVPLGQQLTMSLASLTGEPGAQSTTAAATSTTAAAASGRALARTPSQVPALPADSAQQQPAPGAAPLIGGPILPSPAAGVQQPRRPATAAAPAVQTNPVASAPAAGETRGPMNPGLPPPGSMPSSPPSSTGKLGVDAPASGSMPTGPATTGGKLGER